VDIDPASDLVALPYSSGTTGINKGVMLTHRNLVANLCQGAPALLAGEGERLIAVLPFFHIYGLVVLMAAALSRGSTLVTMPRFDLEQFLALLQDQRITRAYVAPPIVLALAKHPLVDKYDLSALKSVFSGAAPMDASLERACHERLGCEVIQGWGLTETSPVVTTNHNTPRGPQPGSVGVPLPNTEMRVVDPATGADVSRGETGELLVRGPQVMAGYLNAPEATEAMLDPDGWLHTGDLGRIDEHGYVYIVDRVKELIKYKGLQVAPAELEAVLLSHPEVADAAVVRFPDEEAGEVPKAFVVARGQVDPEALMAFVAERVAPHKKVRRVEFVDEIPKAASGKILRRLLIERDRQAAG
jgi:acyl-CoA synthetase (AMP-forming)/AMP-acid ligase II